MGSFTYKLSFQIRHPDADLAIVGHAVGLQPLRIWKSGDQRTTPNGQLLHGFYKESYCTIVFDHAVETRLSDHIVAVLERLRTHRILLEMLADTGATFKFFVAWFSDGNSGESLGYGVLREMADLKVSLDLDVYDGPAEYRIP